QELSEGVRGKRYIWSQPREAVHLGPQNRRSHEPLSVNDVVSEYPLIARELAVELVERLLSGAIYEYAAGVGQRVVSGRSVNRPGARQLFAGLQDLLDCEPSRRRRGT